MELTVGVINFTSIFVSRLTHINKARATMIEDTTPFSFLQQQLLNSWERKTSLPKTVSEKTKTATTRPYDLSHPWPRHTTRIVQHSSYFPTILGIGTPSFRKPFSQKTVQCLGESPTYILNEDTQPVIRAIGVSHTARKDEFRQNL